MSSRLSEAPIRMEALGPTDSLVPTVTPGGIPIRFRAPAAFDGDSTGDPEALRLHLTYRQLHLLRDFDQLLCLEGLTGVEHLPHQIETVRKVLRRFR
ncbi:MAG: hypothetical protein NUV77_10575, partial [Thermoguttaceae bacterium]|nr:hypothetical protein [Thermoguttaceae bacterium]